MWNKIRQIDERGEGSVGQPYKEAENRPQGVTRSRGEKETRGGEQRAEVEKRIREFKKTKSYSELLAKYPEKREKIDRRTIAKHFKELGIKIGKCFKYLQMSTLFP